MALEPIDILVHDYPRNLPISMGSFVYSYVNYNGKIIYKVVNQSSNIAALTEINPSFKQLLRSSMFVKSYTDLDSDLIINAKMNTAISVLDTRDYLLWSDNPDEKWSDDTDITNNMWLRQAGSRFGLLLRTNDMDKNIGVKTEMNAVVGIFSTWNNDSNEVWSDEPNITNGDWIRTTIN